MKPEDLDTIDDLLNADWGEMLKFNRKELQTVISHYAEIANKRRSDALSKLRQSNLPTPAVYKSGQADDLNPNVSWYRYGFNYRRGSDVPEMRKKLRLLKQFLSDKTTTFEGWQDTLNKFIETVQDKGNVVISKRKYKQFWNIYLRAQEHDEIRARLQSTEGGSTQILRQIIDIVSQDKSALWDEDVVIAKMIGVLKTDKENLRKQKEKDLGDIDDEDTTETSYYFTPDDFGMPF